ncbi:MAG: UDP-N-acetylglucosamine 2-epimerase (non-hydrolyzing) [Thermoplasmata archaeon]
MKIASIVGARPQFIKLAPFSTEIRKLCQEVIIDTGQHYDDEMASNFYSEFQIPRPDYSLGIGSGSHSYQTGKMLIELEKVIASAMPDMCVVFGDTNSTIAGAIASKKLGIPLAHVEAGLRSFDRYMPEEINRIVADHLSDLLFCPNEDARRNLANEGITEGVLISGDIMLDTLNASLEAARRHSDVLERLSLCKKEYQLLTCHRPANTDNEQNLKNIISAVEESGEKTVFPVHPRTTKYMDMYRLTNRLPKNLIVTKPLSHMDTIWLAANAKRVLTDSGGLQKEAYILGVPCITLRDTTEWMDTVRVKWNILVGADKGNILRAIKEFVPPAEHPDIFGPAGAARRIASEITRYLEKRRAG